MSDFHNEFHIGGQGNTVHIHQEFIDGNNEALGMILKFLLTILLSPVTIPMILMANGYKMLQEGENDDGN